MKIVAFVPIKLNNERTPNKNIKKFYDGTPLVRLILKTLLEVKIIDEIYLFCSDSSIKPYLVDGVKFLQRSEFLDSDTATPQDIINHFIKKVDADIYIVSHATSPFIKAQSIQVCIEAVLHNGYDSAFSAQKIQKLLWKDNQALNFDAANIPRTQDLTPIYSEVSAAYVFQKKMFLKERKRVGKNPYIHEVSAVEAIDIDYPIDFEIADAIYEKIFQVSASDD